MTKKNIAQKFLLVVFGFVLTVVCLEIVLRIGGAVMERSRRIKVGPHNKDEIVLLCIGESTTALGGRDSWPSQLQGELDRVCPEKHFRVVNEGQAGVGSSYFAGKIVPLLEEHRPDAVISMLGINDYDGYLVTNRADMAVYWFQRLRVVALFRVLASRISFFLSKEQTQLPGSSASVSNLVKSGMQYCRTGDFSLAERDFLNALELDTSTIDAWTGLWQMYELRADAKAIDELAHRLKEWIDGEERLDRGFVDERLYGLLAVYFRDTRKDEKLADKYMLRVRRVRLNYASVVTYENYRRICDVVASGRARMFCVQYPGRDVGPLKKMLEDKKGIIFIDNEQVFADALNEYPYDKIFTDRFAGDFGHMNALGNSILARSVARHIVKTFCPEKEELL